MIRGLIALISLVDFQPNLCRPTAHAQWVIVETRPLRGGGQPVVRRMLRHNAIEAWESMLKTREWKRCQPRW